MKKIIYWGALILTLVSITIVSCKKTDKNETETDDTQTQTQQSSDVSFVQNESENSVSEVDAAVVPSSFGKTVLISGATIDDTTYKSIKKIVITYNGNSADGNRYRTGEIDVQLISGSKWSDKGAVLKINFISFKVTKLSNNTSITINGEHLITNVSGGHIGGSNDTLIKTVHGYMTVLFDEDLTTRNWLIARKITEIFSSKSNSVMLSGDTTIGGFSNIMIWGVNRAGNSFYTQVSTPVLYNSVCPGKPMSGVVVHKAITHEITVTYGVDASGNPETGGGCPYGLKLNWINLKNVSKTAVISY